MEVLGIFRVARFSSVIMAVCVWQPAIILQYSRASEFLFFTRARARGAGGGNGGAQH